MRAQSKVGIIFRASDALARACAVLFVFVCFCAYVAEAEAQGRVERVAPGFLAQVTPASLGYFTTREEAFAAWTAWANTIWLPPVYREEHSNFRACVIDSPPRQWVTLTANL